jgi:thiosulfate/3-mercaptopyruvate sulfurtransferase
MNPRHINQVIAVGTMVLAVTVALALSSRARTPAPAPSSTPPLLAEIEAGSDHIEPLALARELLAAPNDVVLVDLRPSAEYDAFHLPGAHSLTVPEVCGAPGLALLARNPRLFVLYSNGVAHPAQAWAELRRQRPGDGGARIKVLAGGLDEFKATILTPPSLQAGLSEADSKAAAATFKLRRAFFLGDPRPNPLATWATDPPQLTQPTLVSTRWLHDNLGKLAVVDVRPEADFAALHIPGAVHLPVSKLRARTGDRDLFLLRKEQLAQAIGALGIAPSSQVVITTDDKMHDATLTALAFLRVGHRALAILEGGLLRWATERRPLVDTKTTPAPIQYDPQPIDEFAITADEVAARLGGDTTILDVRPAEAFSGAKSTEARPGHIPGAKNRVYTKDLAHTEDGVWLRPRAELEAEYAAVGLRKDGPVVVSCRTGHTASEAYFTLRHLLGHQDVRWYNGSWTEWASRTDLPAATGDQ